jgi:hypothetical protein
MPVTANISNGKTSVCTRPPRELARSAADPGIVEACAANAPPSSPGDRSATSSKLPIPSTAIVPCKNNVGPSMLTAVSAVMR